MAGTGSSTLDFSGLSTSVVFSLGDPTVQPLPNGGSVQVISGNIKTVIGSSHGNRLYGGTGDGVTLMGGAGTDVLAAGAGRQKVIAGNGTATLYGGVGSDTLVAGSGTDTLVAGNAGSGTQTLIGSSGSDTFVGGRGNDVFKGGTGAATFQPRQGNVTITSPASNNTLDYTGDPVPIQANLSMQSIEVPPGKPFAGTTLAARSVSGGFGVASPKVNILGASITTLKGTPGNDLLMTGGKNDVVSGGGGADMFIVLNGNNMLSDSAGSRPTFLFDGPGSNTINGGGNGIVDFSEAPAAVFVNLGAQRATGGFGGALPQILQGITTVYGTDRTFNDVLIGGATLPNHQRQQSVLYGQGVGRDVLQAGPGGDDKLFGGDGDTTFCSDPHCAFPHTTTSGGASAATQNQMTGGLGRNFFFVRNNGYDRIVGSGSFNVAQIDPKLDTAINIQRFL
jgi:Ca2+-binding RTX toxin-like protein